ncbi:flavodoxin FldA [Gloeobacter violaceus]|uniref:Flavodoxin n=1 Tax=Gloeobacter violaceus (strain ATCC 29082 / PCC 7421) TaxID=251221 RepID=Q7NNV1_GLOVI|nr:flavodoxin FldA [Gloeobacter violaceus]BAC88248.1 flavodoxin [Gloeobacter violaceus PCC 7421]
MPEKIRLFYGTTTGKTLDAASMIKDAFGGDTVTLYDISETDKEDLTGAALLIIGCPTWDIGQLQSDWDAFFPVLGDIDFTGKKIAYFGTGDQVGYSENFQDAMGILEAKISERGGTTLGRWPADGYDFNASLAVKNGKFVGLALDDDNQSRLTDKRIKDWVAQLKKEFGV